MSQTRRSLVLLVAQLGWTHPSYAEGWGDWSDGSWPRGYNLDGLVDGLGWTLGALFVAAPAVTFATADTIHLALGKRVPATLRWSQVGWGAACVVGGTLAHFVEPAEDPVALSVIVGGAVFASYPLIEMSLRGEEQPGAALGITPGGVQVTGRF